MPSPGSTTYVRDSRILLKISDRLHRDSGGIQPPRRMPSCPTPRSLGRVCNTVLLVSSSKLPYGHQNLLAASREFGDLFIHQAFLIVRQPCDFRVNHVELVFREHESENLEPGSSVRGGRCVCRLRDGFPGTPTDLRFHDLVRGPLLEVTVLMDARFVREARLRPTMALLGCGLEADDGD